MGFIMKMIWFWKSREKETGYQMFMLSYRTEWEVSSQGVLPCSGAKHPFTGGFAEGTGVL